jgi:spermidine/putrescine-binding protein
MQKLEQTNLVKAVSKIILVVVLVVVIAVAGGVTYYYVTSTSNKSITLTIATWGGPWQPAMKAAAQEFTNETGIQVNIEAQANVNVQLPKMLTGDSGVDIWTTDGPEVIALADAGLAVPLTGQSNLQYIPNNLNEVINGTTYGAGFELWAMGICYNSNDIKTAPTSWNLTSISSDSNLGIMQATFYQGASLVQWSLVAGGNEKNVSSGWNALEKMAPQAVFAADDDASLENALQTGAVSIMAPCPIADAYPAFQAGAPVHVVIPVGSPTFELNDMIAAVKGPHETQALQFINFFLSGAQQTSFVSTIGALPASSQATVSSQVLQYMGISTTQLAQQAYIPDWGYVNGQISNWTTYYTNNVVPSLKG